MVVLTAALVSVATGRQSSGGSSPRAGVTLPATSRAPTVLRSGTSTLSFTPLHVASRHGSRAKAAGNRGVTFDSVDKATDTEVATDSPTEFETTETIEARTGPDHFSWKVASGGTEKLETTPAGAVDVVRLPSATSRSASGSLTGTTESATVVATVEPPQAHDAQGREVPATLEASGNIVTMHVDDGEQGMTFPVTVDPIVRAESTETSCPQIVQSAVSSNGTGVFTLNCEPWQPIGFNDYRVMDYAAPNPYIQTSTVDQGCGQIVDEEDQTWELQQIAATGANVVRVWFYQKYYQDYLEDNPTGSGWWPYIQLLKAAQAAGLKVIPVLINNWDQCDREDGTLNDANSLSSTFYQSGYTSPQFGYSESAEQWAENVAAEFSPNTTDPNAAGLWQDIAYFQIANEAEVDEPSPDDTAIPTADREEITQQGPGITPACTPDGATILEQFGQTMGTAIKQAYVGDSTVAAPLVSMGTMGIGQCGVSSSVAAPLSVPHLDDYAEVYSAPAIDVCDVHDYDAEDQSDPTYDWYGLPDNNLAQRIADCGSKPLVIGEAGIEANVTAGATTRADSTALPTTASLGLRAQYLSNKMAAAFDAGVAGYVDWDKIMAGSASAWNVENDQSLGYGSYGSGPPQGLGTQDPALCVIKQFTTPGGWLPGAPPPDAASACNSFPVPVPGPTDHYAFVDGTTEGWAKNNGWGDLGTSYSAAENHGGNAHPSDTSGALQITIAGNPNLDSSTQIAPGDPDFNPYSEIEVESASVALLTPGAVVTMYIYNATNACPNLGVKPVLRVSDAGAGTGSDPGWDVVSPSDIDPAAGEWTELSMTVPTTDPSTGNPVATVNAVGLEVDVPQTSSGVWETACEGQSVYLDDATW